MASDDQSDSSHEIPYLVYHTSGEDGDMYFDILHQRFGQKNIPWFRNSVQLDANSGWLLQFNVETGQLSLLHHCTGEELSLPNLPDELHNTQIGRNFIWRLCESRSDWHVMAIHKIEKIIYLYRPRRTDWEIYNFSVPELDEPNAIQEASGATVRGGKIYVQITPHLIVISIIDGTPKVTGTENRGPWENIDISPPTPYCFDLRFFLESDGDFYEVMVHLFECKYQSRPRTVTVTRLNQSADQQWEILTSIGNKVFLLGNYYSASLPAAKYGVQGDMVYFSHRGNTYAFHVRSRSLTSYFHCQHQIVNSPAPSWLLFGEHQFEEVGNDHMEICCRTVSQFLVDENFDHPINIATYQPARNLLAKKGGFVTWCPKTPWLLVKHGYDSILKFFDPCSNCFYALDVPELSDKPLHHSRDGWVLVSFASRSWFFFNPFTKQMKGLQKMLSSHHDIFGISSSPASRECLVFSIFRYTETTGEINLFNVADNDLSLLTYTSSLPLDASSSSPVYHNGLFYCLAINGNLGMFNPIERLRFVNNKPLVLFDASLARTCYLIESDSELFSVFLDKYDNPIGVFCLDSDEERWIEVKHLKDKTIFLGKEASFIVPAPERRMANKIYLPVFHGQSDHELRAHEIGVDHSFDVKCFTTREYLSMWIEPKGVIFELDQTTGRFNHPTIRLIHA